MSRSFFHSIFTSLCIAITLSSAHHTLAQEGRISTLIKAFDGYRTQTIHEKIYVHSDRNSYLTGETMWFKIYVTDATFHKPLGMSKVAYLEFIDTHNQSVLQTKVELKNGSGAGSLFIPATLNGGNYQLRAYTNWMKNFGAEFYFSKPVSIINPFKGGEAEEKQTALAVDAQFFPEGGNMVAGIPAKIAFRVTDATGKGMDFKGTLLNQQNDTVASFTPQRFGIGHFTFTPQPSEVYRAVIQNQAGKTTTINLPPALTNGYTLHTSDSLDKVLVTVNTTLSALNPEVYLFVHARNSIALAVARKLQKNTTTFLIDRKDLADGISHFTIFDGSMSPVCERLYFKQPEKNLSIKIQPSQTQYGLRRPVKIDLTTRVNQQPNQSNISISVYKTDSLPAFSGSMLEYFWLTSDLKGNIESPEYYLTSTPETNEAIDNVMLTHGWRRFKWNDVLSNSKPASRFLPEVSGHIVSGTIKAEDGSIAAGKIAYLSSPGKIAWLYPSLSDAQGNVLFEMQNFYGSSKIITQTNPKTDSTLKVFIASPFSDQYATNPTVPFHLSKKSEDQLLNRSIAMQVQDIYYANKEKIIQPKIDSTAFYGKADETYLLDAFTRFPVMEEVMREYVPGVYVRKRRDGFHFLVANTPNKTVFTETPMVLLDGLPIFDEDEIMEFDPLKVKKLEVVTKQWYLGPLSFSGIVSYTTYLGDLDGFTINPHSVSLNYEGLQLQREFYSPKYEHQKDRESRLPDQRYLLYWNPHVHTQADGKTGVEFYTSDIAGEYKIVVEGITPGGAVGSSTTTVEVREFNN